MTQNEKQIICPFTCCVCKLKLKKYFITTGNILRKNNLLQKKKKVCIKVRLRKPVPKNVIVNLYLFMISPAKKK